jgi:hypothetical protein
MIAFFKNILPSRRALDAMFRFSSLFNAALDRRDVPCILGVQFSSIFSFKLCENFGANSVRHTLIYEPKALII